MRVYFLLLFFSASAFVQLNAQERTGVWRGLVRFGSAGFTFGSNNIIVPLAGVSSDVRGRAGRMPVNSAGVIITSTTEYDTKAKLEFLQVNDQLLAQLTSYNDENTKVTMYEFYVRPTPKEFYKYHLQGRSVIVNEAKKKADLFDLRGNFLTTDSSILFQGIWEHQFRDRRFGSFIFQQTEEPVTINPELFYTFLKSKKINENQIYATGKPQAIPIYDTLITDAIALYGNLVDNGIIDQDTLSIWLNGKILEDNVIPGKKPFVFRANLSEQEWNHFTIRCKSEGKEKGAGVHFNLQLNDVQLKYNLILYQYHQADWIIRRPAKPKLGIK